MTFDAFDAVTVTTRQTSIFLRRHGSGPPLLWSLLAQPEPLPERLLACGPP